MGAAQNEIMSIERRYKEMRTVQKKRQSLGSQGMSMAVMTFF